MQGSSAGYGLMRPCLSLKPDGQSEITAQRCLPTEIPPTRDSVVRLPIRRVKVL